MPVIRAPRAKRSITTKTGKVITRDTQVHVYTEPGKFCRGLNGELCFRIYGEPMPAAKKEVAAIKRGNNVQLVPIDRDYRVATDPKTGKPFKWDIGYMRRWTDHCRRCVLELMQQYGLQRFAQGEPLAVGMLFYRSQADSNDSWMPAQKPDYSNFYYAVENALKMTPGTHKKYDNGQKYFLPGPFPEGVLYYDDDQVCWQLEPAGKVWATADEPPGVLISVMHCKLLSERVRRLAYPRANQTDLFTTARRV